MSFLTSDFQFFGLNKRRILAMKEQSEDNECEEHTIVIVYFDTGKKLKLTVDREDVAGLFNFYTDNPTDE